MFIFFLQSKFNYIYGSLYINKALFLCARKPQTIPKYYKY